MKINNLSAEDKEALKQKSRKKIQSLINYGFNVMSSNDKKQTSETNRIVNSLENDETFILTIPTQTCICLKVSNMVIKLLKPYIKDLLHIEQKATKTNYILFSYDEDIIEQFEPLAEPNEDLQLIDTFELPFTKYTLPTYTNTARLYSVTSAPVLTPKEVNKILSLYETITANKNSYFLLSNSISLAYNMPMSILRILGENVISLKALNILELIMVFATNSSAIYRQPTEDIKHFAIPVDFFYHDDFDIKQTADELINSINELKSIGLINAFEYVEGKFIINANIIVKSIKQYSYKQELKYYRSLGLHQQNYVYTFINYLRYVKNIKHIETTTDISGNTIKQPIKAKALTITLEGLMYNLELDKYIHDLTHIATILDVLKHVGIEQGLLLIPSNIQSTTKDLVRYLLNHRDRLHEFFVLNPDEKNRVDSKSSTSYCNFSRTTHGRYLVQR